MPKFTVRHSANYYIFDSESKAEPKVEDAGHYTMPDRRLVYLYDLIGAHGGKPIRIKMVGVKEEFDDSVPRGAWDELVFADNDEQVDDVIDDFYHDALRKDLEETIRETWD